jgi:hypothetical protein
MRFSDSYRDAEEEHVSSCDDLKQGFDFPSDDAFSNSGRITATKIRTASPGTLGSMDRD